VQPPFPLTRRANPGSVSSVDEDPSTQELRLEQAAREARERESAREAATEEDTQTHRRRADKAGYLREKLAERERSEDG